jgi:hypothetical protein
MQRDSCEICTAKSGFVPMRIDTHNGFTILADDADYELLSRYNWHCQKKGENAYAYARLRSKGRGTGPGKIVSMHRFLMKPDPDLVVHHRNGNGLDNRRENLQVTTTRVNIRHAHIKLKCPSCADPIDEWWLYCAMCGIDLNRAALEPVIRKALATFKPGET